MYIWYLFKITLLFIYISVKYPVLGYRHFFFFFCFFSLFLLWRLKPTHTHSWSYVPRRVSRNLGMDFTGHRLRLDYQLGLKKESSKSIFRLRLNLEPVRREKKKLKTVITRKKKKKKSPKPTSKRNRTLRWERILSWFSNCTSPELQIWPVER